MLGLALLFARWFLEQMLIGGNDDVIAALVELADGVNANVGWQLRVEHTRAYAKLFQKQAYPEGSR